MEFQTKTCQNCKKDFVIEPDDFAFYEKMKVPPPTWCPECRAQRRLLWRNEKNLFKKPSALDGKEIFSNFPKEASVKIFPKDYWWGDGWNALEYGREYDFSTPFFQQIGTLLSVVPLPSRALIGDVVNSDYSMNAGYLKNCYLVFNSDYTEDSFYVNSSTHAKNCADCLMVRDSELCYESVNITNCYRASFSADCTNCSDVMFSRDCVGCNDCIGCVGLRNKKYHIFNKPYSKEEYLAEKQRMGLGAYSATTPIKEKRGYIWNTMPVKFIHGRKNTNSTGEYLFNSKDVISSYRVNEGENLKFCQLILFGPAKDSYDHTIWGDGTELIYEAGQAGGGAHNIRFSWGVYGNVKDIEYSFFCHSSSNLFACVGLRNKQYCILNKQYSKEEYEALVSKIKEHMNTIPYTDKKGRIYTYGEFFPPELSPFAYNETIAQEYFPLTKEEAEKQGYAWRDSDAKAYAVTVKPADIPDNIKDVPDSIMNEIIGCAHAAPPADGCNHQCAAAFKVIPQELAFYRQMNLPLPRLCPNCRHYERLAQRNPLKLWNRTCECEGEQSKLKGQNQYTNTMPHTHGDKPCPNEFETSYAPDRPEIVYCESCYNAEVA